VTNETFYQLDLQSRSHNKWFREDREFATVEDLMQTMKVQIADNPERWRVVEVTRTEKVLSLKMLMERMKPTNRSQP
jgi:hypothetical protein